MKEKGKENKLINMDRSSKKPIIISFVCAVLFFVLALVSFRERIVVKSENLFFNAAEPVLSFVNSLTDNVSLFFERVFYPSQIQQENEELKKKISSLERELVLFEEVSRENARLSELLQYVEQNADMRYVTASVIARNIDDSSESLTLNAGTRHGVSVKTPVITADGVIGRVTEVGNSWCKVHTVMNDEMRLSVLVDRTREEGTLGGFVRVNGEVTGLKLYYLPEDSDVCVGDRIVTSSSGGIFPKGIYVGNVVSLNEEENASYSAVVKSEIDFKSVEEVLLVVDMDDNGYD